MKCARSASGTASYAGWQASAVCSWLKFHFAEGFNAGFNRRVGAK